MESYSWKRENCFRSSLIDRDGYVLCYVHTNMYVDHWDVVIYFPFDNPAIFEAFYKDIDEAEREATNLIRRECERCVERYNKIMAKLPH